MTDAQGSGEILDPRDQKGRFQPGNQAYKKRAADPDTGFPVAKDANVVTWRNPDTGKVHYIPLNLEKLKDVLLSQALDEFEASFRLRAEKAAQEAARDEWAKMVRLAGGDPREIMAAQLAVHAKDGTVLEIVHAMAEKAKGGTVAAAQTYLQLVRESREWFKSDGGEAGMEKDDIKAMEDLVAQYEVEPEKDDEA